MALFMSPQFLNFGENCVLDPITYSVSGKQRPLFYEAMIPSRLSWMAQRDVYQDYGEVIGTMGGLTDFITFVDFLRELLDYSAIGKD